MCELGKNEFMQILPLYREIKIDLFCDSVTNLEVSEKKEITRMV